MRRVTAVVLVLLAVTPAYAVKIADITRIGGQRSNVLTGLGLVYGLRGTGDGGDFLPMIRPLAAMLAKVKDSATIQELGNVQNVALVSLTATIPSNGVRNGDKIDVYVLSLGAASSLRGGRLFVSPMTGPMASEQIFALSDGAVVLEDPSTPTVGIVKGGCTMEVDLPAKYVEDGKFTLILEDAAASWTTASNIAKIINDAGDGDVGELLAVAVDPKNVLVTIPKSERERPDSFISRVQLLPVLMQPTEARVTINDRTGTIIMTGDVEISPVVISHRGLTITTINPAPVPTPRAPITSSRDVVALDTTNEGGAKLQDLVNALDQLKVPSEDRIYIVKELHKTGKLHAKLITD